VLSGHAALAIGNAQSIKALQDELAVRERAQRDLESSDVEHRDHRRCNFPIS